MKLHLNLCRAVISGLSEVLINGQQADTVIEHLLQSNKSWGARDRNFIASNIYEIVRYKRLYEYCCGISELNEAALWQMLACILLLQQIELPAWNEFSTVNPDGFQVRFAKAQTIRKIRESVPDWLDEMGEKELGAKWDDELAALNETAKLCIRFNTIKTGKKNFINILNKDGIEFNTTELAPDALIITGRKNLKQHPAYKHGLFEVQDVSSQQVAPFLQPEPGMRVIDCCAGAGGKTLHLVALMQNKGEIIAMDISPKKLEVLTARAERAGCSIIKSMGAEKLFPEIPKYLLQSADRVLIDVPCSGLGVLRRKPDAKWKLSPQFMEDIKRKQAELLNHYSLLLKPGGYLVYSTCSILPSENEEQVRNFVEKQKGFELIEEKKISAADSGFDGFYMARMNCKLQ